MPQCDTIRRASLRRLAQIVFRTGAVFVVDDFFGGAAPMHEDEPIVQFASGRCSGGLLPAQVASRRARGRAAQSSPYARDQRPAASTPRARGPLRDRRSSFFLCRQNLFALRTHQHLVAGVFKVVHIDEVLAVPCCPEGRFVDEVANVGAGHADRAGGESFDIDIAARAARRGNGP